MGLQERRLTDFSAFETFPKTSSAYDEIEFIGHPTRSLHPLQIAALAYLRGAPKLALQSAKIACVGCGSGAAIIPLALEFPNAHFFAIDPASKLLQRGEEYAKEVGIENITWQASAVEDSAQEIFDLVLLHGVYSWIPQTARSALLDALNQRTRPGSLLHCTHNVSPGWQIREVIAKFLQVECDFHSTTTVTSSAQKISAARRRLAALESQIDPGSHFGQTALPEIRRLKRVSDGYLYHELLNPSTDGVALRELATTFSGFDFTWIGDSRGSRMVEPPSALFEDSDPLTRATGLDFTKGQAFRESIFLRTDKHSPRIKDASPLIRARLADCFFTHSFFALPGNQASRSAPPPPTSADEKKIVSCLIESWPEFISFDTIKERCGLATTKVESSLERLIGLDIVYISTDAVVQRQDAQEGSVSPLPWLAHALKNKLPLVNEHFETVQIGGFEENLLRGITQEGHTTQLSLASYLRSQVGESDDPMLKDEKQLQNIIRQGIETLARALLIR